jgi:hypothetical protein
MLAHNVVECWGNTPREISVTPHSDRKDAERCWEQKVREYLDGSSRDVEAEIRNAKAFGSENMGTPAVFAFTHSDGFIALETVAVRDPA